MPRTGFAVASSAQHFSGKPWAASTQISLPQGNQRVLLEPRGTLASVGVTIGTVLGSRVLARVPEVWFRRVLALILAVLGGAMLLRGIRP